MTKDEMFAAVATHRAAFADQLGALAPEQWDVASLCAGWRVRDVLGHLVSLLDVPRRRFVVGVFGMSGFHRRVDQFARQYGDRAPTELLEMYRQSAGRRMAPPIIGPIAPLSDVVVHSLDVERPLGLPHVHTEAAARTVLDALCGGLAGFTSKKTVRGLRFEATDVDWHLGEGPMVRGEVADILLATTGRLDAATIDGDGAGALRTRLGR